MNHAASKSDDTPEEGPIESGLALLRQLANATPADWSTLKHAARDWQTRFEAGRDTRRRQLHLRLPHDRSVDGWILDIFTATESAISREQLLTDFTARYRKERRLVDHERHAGPWLFEFRLDASAPPDQALQALQAAGVHPAAWAQYTAQHLPAWREDPYLSAVFADQLDLDGWHPLWFGRSALFDALLNIQQRFLGESDYWVNAVALQGDGRQAMRGLFLLHPNASPLEDPVPPPNMKQDQRLLVVLSLAWRQLEHQVKALARLTEADRREMIQLLAPGLLHHELGSAMNSISSQAHELKAELQALAQANPEYPLLAEHAQRASSLAALASRAFNITDAFNNLDKRAPLETLSLQRVCTGVRQLLMHRLGGVGVDLAWDEAAFEAITLHTDAVMLTQALLNLINNALNAFAEHPVRPPRRVRLLLGRLDERSLQLHIVNNGPPIALADQPELFRRGYTTRAQGHGQGLYLSRLIARYLGGELNLMEVAALPDGYRVGFRLSLLKELAASEGVARHVSQ